MQRKLAIGDRLPKNKTMRTSTKIILGIAALTLVLLTGWLGFQQVKSNPLYEECENPGWFPTEFGLKDHSIFWYDGYYYIVSIFLPPEDRFAYARSDNFCDWEVLSPILTERIPGAWDEMSIWAPFVFEEDGNYFHYDFESRRHGIHVAPRHTA